MMADAKTLERQDAVVEPPKRWFNWWRALVPHETEDRSGRLITLEAGEVSRSDLPWPSRDAAESFAAEALAYNAANAPGLLEYEGAYPEGERP